MSKVFWCVKCQSQRQPEEVKAKIVITYEANDIDVDSNGLVINDQKLAKTDTNTLLYCKTCFGTEVVIRDTEEGSWDSKLA